MSCSSCNCNPCHCEEECDPSNEPLSSALDNFTLAFFGTVTKTCVNGQVVWDLPCDLDSGIPGFPRIAGEGLACYILRILAIPAPTEIAIQDEGVEITAAAAQINFVGDGVTATAVGNNVTVTIPTPTPDDCCYEAQTVWVDNRAVELFARGVPAYLTFQEAYDAANTMQVALGGSNVVNLSIGVITAAESGNLNLTADYNPNVTITGVNQQASMLGTINGDSAVDGVAGRNITVKLQSVSVNGIVSRYVGADTVTNGGNLVITAISDVFLGPVDSSSLSGGSGGTIDILSDRGAGTVLGTVSGDVTSHGRINGGILTIVGIATANLDVRGDTGIGGFLFVQDCTIGTVLMGANNPGRIRMFDSFSQQIDWVKGGTPGVQSIFSSVIFTTNNNEDCIDDVFSDGAIFMNCIFDPNNAGVCINSTTPKTVIVYNGLSRTIQGALVTVTGTLTVDPSIMAPY